MYIHTCIHTWIFRVSWNRIAQADSLNQNWHVSKFAKIQLRFSGRIHALVNLVSLPNALVNLVFQRALVNLVSLPKSTCQSCQYSKEHLSILSVFQNALVNLVSLPKCTCQSCLDSKTLVNLVNFMHVHVSLPELWAPANQRWQIPSRDKIRGETHSHPESRLSSS